MQVTQNQVAGQQKLSALNQILTLRKSKSV
jgi:hypothetical protein